MLTGLMLAAEAQRVTGFHTDQWKGYARISFTQEQGKRMQDRSFSD
jgi:hypothetical protein